MKFHLKNEIDPALEQRCRDRVVFEGHILQFYTIYDEIDDQEVFVIDDSGIPVDSRPEDQVLNHYLRLKEYKIKKNERVQRDAQKVGRNV